MVLEKNILFVAGGKGLAVFDVTDPSNMTRLWKGETGVASYDCWPHIQLDQQRKLLFFVGDKGLAVFNVNDPHNPERVWKGETGVIQHAGDRGKGADGGGGTIALAPGSKLAFVVGGGGLASLDVSDPCTGVKILGKVDTHVCCYGSNGCVKLDPTGSAAFVAGPRGVAIIDVTDPCAMVAKSKDKTGVQSGRMGGGNDYIDFHGGYSYIGGGWGLAVCQLEELEMLSF